MKNLFWLTVSTFFFGLMVMLAIVNIIQGDAILAVLNVVAAGLNLFSASLHYQPLAERLKQQEI